MGIDVPNTPREIVTGTFYCAEQTNVQIDLSRQRKQVQKSRYFDHIYSDCHQ